MNYEIVCGLEVHVEMNTRSKIFCACSTAFGGEPNTHVCPVCSGQPGRCPRSTAPRWRRPRARALRWAATSRP